MNNRPPPIPYERVITGRMVGYARSFGPGRQALHIGSLCVGFELIGVLFWLFVPPGAKFIALLLAGWSLLVVGLVYFVMLPAMLVGVARATTACRLQIEFRARTAGVVLNLLGIALWAFVVRSWLR